MAIKKNINLHMYICRVLVAPLESVQSIANGPYSYSRIVTLKSGEAWTEIYLTPGTGEFSEKPKETEAGMLYEQNVRIQFPGLAESNRADLSALEARPLLVAIAIGLEVTKYLLVGYTDNGARMNSNFQLNSKSSGAIIEFSCNSTRKACWLAQSL